ncbi:MAG: glycosyltransferase family 2 protein [Pseudomonadota bacterium]
MPDVVAIVVTYDAEPYVARALESLGDIGTVVVDNGSSDGTVRLVRERFPEVTLVEQANRGLAAGWNAGMRAAPDARYYLFLNADAWLVGDALDRLVAYADAHPRAAYVGPRLRYPDGRLQRSVRGFPTLWRLATEYLFLRKLAPRSRLLNAYYGAGFAHDRVLEAEWLMGAAFLARREAVEEVGPADEDFFLFGEETDWCKRFRDAGWQVVFVPDAEVVHVLGAAHGGRMFRELVGAHLRWLAKHRGVPYAERARLLLAWSLALRGVAFRGERGRTYAATSRWLRSSRVPALLAR